MQRISVRRAETKSVSIARGSFVYSFFAIRTQHVQSNLNPAVLARKPIYFDGDYRFYR